MGQDGSATSLIARDAYGFSLNYFTGDYKSISTTVTPFVTVPMVLPAQPVTNISTGAQLYNGNIGAMVVNTPKLGAANIYGYKYDQLNRIVRMDAFNNLSNTTNSFATTPTRINDYHEEISYDPNGNIKSYLRNGTTQGSSLLGMDSLTYQYERLANGQIKSNKLRYVHDQVADANYATEDINSQKASTFTVTDVQNDIGGSVTSDNYEYDAIGNLIKDTKEGITNIEWTVYGKISKITKSGSIISYSYDASGNRISKVFSSGGVDKATYYVRDASGNVMSVYTRDSSTATNTIIAPLSQTELHLYGSSRLGVYNVNVDVQNCLNPPNPITIFSRGNKFFELSNHLGNVLVTISDKILQVTADGTTVSYYNAGVITAKNYYPFGMQMPDSVYKTGGAYFMNGTTLSMDSSYTIPDAANNFTIEFWAKPTATHRIDSEGYIWGGIAGQRYLVAPGFLAGTSVGMGVSVGTNGVSVYEHGPSYIPALLVWQSPSAITDWIHVAVVYQNKQPKLYINGQLVRTGLVSSKQFVYPSFNFTGYGYGTYLGYVDEMRIWKEARTQQQIKDNRYGTVAVPQANLSGYWPLSASNGSTLVDISGNNRSVPLNSNTGRLTGDVGGNAYRYGFNGQEKSDEIKGEGSSYTAEFWEYDPRIGRRWNIDPEEKSILTKALIAHLIIAPFIKMTLTEVLVLLLLINNRK